MTRVLLTVDDLNAMQQTDAHQAGQGHLGSIRDGGEHGLTKQGPAQIDEIKPRHQFILNPNFAAVGQTHPVQ